MNGGEPCNQLCCVCLAMVVLMPFFFFFFFFFEKKRCGSKLINYRHQEIEFSDIQCSFKEKDQIGSGTYAKVFRGKIRGVDVAIKGLLFFFLFFSYSMLKMFWVAFSTKFGQNLAKLCCK